MKLNLLQYFALTLLCALLACSSSTVFAVSIDDVIESLEEDQSWLERPLTIQFVHTEEILLGEKTEVSPRNRATTYLGEAVLGNNEMKALLRLQSSTGGSEFVSAKKVFIESDAQHLSYYLHDTNASSASATEPSLLNPGEAITLFYIRRANSDHG